MAKPVPVEIRITDLPQFKQLVSSVATLLGVLAREGGDLPEIAHLAADQVKRDLGALGGRDIGPPLGTSDEDRIRDAMPEAPFTLLPHHHEVTMICVPCRWRHHSQCPEVARQADATLSDVDRLASTLCDCQHQQR